MARMTRVLLDLLKPDVLGFALHTRSLSQWMLAALRKQGVAVLETGNRDIIIEYRDCKFRLNPMTCHPIFGVYDDYRFDRIRPDDIVLDIGAQIGAFAIPASRLARSVYAVEPVFCPELHDSISLNLVSNVVPMRFAVGQSAEQQTIDYWGVSSECQVVTFGELHRRIGRVDALKIDCEGCEWSINPTDLAGIRVIEAELHTFGLGIAARRKRTEWIRWLEGNNYDYELEHIDSTRCMLHAERRE